MSNYHKTEAPKMDIPQSRKKMFFLLIMILAFLVVLSYALMVFPKPEPTSTTTPTPVPLAEPNTKQASIPANLGSCVKAPVERIVRMKVTAYCPCDKCCGPNAIGKTSTGHDAWKTFGIAADPRLLRYRTKLEIPGVGVREVDDTGGAMRQDAKKGICHIDLRMHSHQEARKFGVKWLEVKILPR
jgi:3D (Asp-Asp-Asp) domain-containing protein